MYCGHNPVMFSLGYNTRRSISSSISTLGQSYTSIGSYNSGKSPSKINNSIIGSSTRPIINGVSMTNLSTILFDNVLIGMALGNISHTITMQHNDYGVFYAYSNIGNSTSSVGVGLNIKDWYGLNVYMSSNVGIGSSMQLGSFTYGAEISVLDGISLSFGTVSGNVTNETTVSIGWGTLAFAYTACGVIVSTPVPFARVATGVAAGVIFIIDIFN